MAESTGKTKTLAKNTIYLYIRMLLVMAVSVYTSRVVLSTLGFEDFGIYSVVAGIVVTLNFLQSALRNATFRYSAYEIGTGDNARLSKVFSMAVNTHILLAIILFVVLEIVGLWYLNTYAVIPVNRIYAANVVFQFSLLLTVISIIRTPFESLIIAYERMDFYALISIVEVILKLLIVYLLVLFPFDKLVFYSALLAAVTFLLSFCYIFYCKRVFNDCKYYKVWDKGLLKEFVTYSGWSVLVNGACMARSQGLVFFFNYFLGLIANAALGIANQVMGALNMFVTNFSQAFNPQIVKSWANKDYSYFHRLIFSASKISYYLLLIVSIPIICNLDFLLEVWLGDYPEMTGVYIQSIILYYLIDSMQMPLVNAVHATGDLKRHQIIISIIVFLYIPLSYFLLRIGYSGQVVLLINAVFNLFCAIARVWIMKDLISLDVPEYLLKVVLPIIIVSLLVIPIQLFVSSKYIQGIWPVIFFTMGSVIYTSVVILLVGLDNREKKLVYSSRFFSNISQRWERK